MKLFYRGVALHQVGTLFVSDGFEHAGPELPTRQRRTLRARLDTPDDVSDWAVHRAAVDGVKAALSVPEGLLRWEQDDGTVYLEQSVTVAGAPAYPQDTDPQGRFTQAVEVVFAWHEELTPPRLTTTFQPITDPETAALDLGEVAGLDSESSAIRPTEYQDFEERVAGRLALSGKLYAPDPAATLEVRRAALQTLLAALEAAFDHGHGRLVHQLGAVSFFNRVIRRDVFRARINQAVEAIEWSLDAGYTRFPDESDFRLARYTVKTSENRETGELLTSLSGSVRATTLTSAHAAVDALATAYGGGCAASPNERDAQRVSNKAGVTNAAAVEAGTRTESASEVAFIELTFNLGFKKLTGSLVSAALRFGDSVDLASGLVTRTYQGSVTMQHAGSWDVAYQAAVAKANELAGNKHPFCLRSSVGVADNRATYDRVVTGAYHVTVEFAYEYRVTGDRVFVELTVDTVDERFGQKALNVQGRIRAPSSATAASIHASLKATLSAGGRLRGGRFAERSERVAPGTAPVGVTYTPSRSTISWGTAANGGEAADTWLSGYTRQFLGYDFSFQVFLQRVSGTSEVSLVYKVRTELDYRSLTKTTGVSGQVFARDTTDAEAAVATLRTALGLDVTDSLVRQGAEQDNERYLGTPLAGEPTTPYLVGYAFSLEYAGKVAGEAALLECSASEAIKHSGLEPVVVRVARGRPKVQQHSYTEARRTVRGSATAASEAVVRAWLATLVTMPLNQTLAAGVVRAAAAPEVSLGWETVPRTVGVFRAVPASGEVAAVPANFRVCRGELSFEEVFDQLDYA